MKNRNMSDMIEEYLKSAISEDGRIEIQRNELANLFDCVPSQINYVINTRFSRFNMVMRLKASVVVVVIYESLKCKLKIIRKWSTECVN